MSDWRKNEDARAEATPLTKIVINGVEKTTLAQKLAFKDIVWAAGRYDAFRDGKRVRVFFAHKDRDTGVELTGELSAQAAGIEVRDGMRFTVEVEDERVQSNSTARR